MGLFVAVRGTISDGHNYIDQAISKGAIAVVCEQVPEKIIENITYVQVSSSTDALGIIASNFYENPSEKLKLIAVTGTNGKTTTATLLYRLAKSLGYKAGLISTVVNRINDREIHATHTTPDAVSLQKLLHEMVEEHCDYCFMEASSHALHQGRLTGTNISGAVFTNITHDHLDYHGTFREYIAAKKILFDILNSGSFAVINIDDKNGPIMTQNSKAKVRTYGLERMADYKAKVLDNGFGGLHLLLDHQDLHTKLIGEFNAYNLLAVYAVASELGWSKIDVLTKLSVLDPPDGRFQYTLSAQGTAAIVDYAHTPDALKNVLETIAKARTGNEKLITVVGCGGDRDKTKRPEMASIAASMSDQVILTSDNPRSEDPETIIAEMLAGLDPVMRRRTLSISDRAEAIKTACALASGGDIILIAGKGHEKYQEIKGVKYPFDDYSIVHEILHPKT
jgi:UDP-N-acetylmuramoyl-L-alanyl-D-glutamate--2,6-diaminopimelate ligase